MTINNTDLNGISVSTFLQNLGEPFLLTLVKVGDSSIRRTLNVTEITTNTGYTQLTATTVSFSGIAFTGDEFYFSFSKGTEGAQGDTGAQGVAGPVEAGNWNYSVTNVGEIDFATRTHDTGMTLVQNDSTPTSSQVSIFGTTWANVNDISVGKSNTLAIPLEQGGNVVKIRIENNLANFGEYDVQYAGDTVAYSTFSCTLTNSGGSPSFNSTATVYVLLSHWDVELSDRYSQITLVSHNKSTSTINSTDQQNNPPRIYFSAVNSTTFNTGDNLLVDAKLKYEPGDENVGCLFGYLGKLGSSNIFRYCYEPDAVAISDIASGSTSTTRYGSPISLGFQYYERGAGTEYGLVQLSGLKLSN